MNGPLLREAHRIVFGSVMGLDKPLTTDEKIALARAPITRGVLSRLGTNHIPGKPACGCGNDGAKSPVTGKLGGVVGWMRNPQKQR